MSTLDVSKEAHVYVDVSKVCVPAEAGQRHDASDDGTGDVLKLNGSAPRHVIKEHVDFRYVDDVTHRRRRKHHLPLIHSSHQQKQQRP